MRLHEWMSKEPHRKAAWLHDQTKKVDPQGKGISPRMCNYAVLPTWHIGLLWNAALIVIVTQGEVDFADLLPYRRAHGMRRKLEAALSRRQTLQIDARATNGSQPDPKSRLPADRALEEQRTGDL